MVRTSPQLVPLLKRLADSENPLRPQEIILNLGLRPRQATINHSILTAWQNVQISRISGTFDIHLTHESEPMLHIATRSRVVADENRTALIAADIFDVVGRGRPPSGRGWWLFYPCPLARRLELCVTFDNPTKRKTSSLLSAAMIDRFRR